MLSRLMQNIKIILSQVQPGLAIHGTRIFTALFVILAVIAVFMDFYPSEKAASAFKLPRAQATAAALNSGIDGEQLFSQMQKRYMQKALMARADNLVKMHGATVSAALGEASLIRADLPTVVWQYRSNICVLDIFFKAESEDVVLSPVIHYEIRSREMSEGASSTQTDDRRCIRSLIPSSGMARLLNVNTFYKSRQ
jgi:hypothetical protein